MGKENQSFKQVIQSYLEQRAKRDSLFATSFAKQNKNIDECCNYIIGEAKKRGGNAVFMSDDEVFGLAVHYYDEDDIKVSKQTRHLRLVAAHRPGVPGVGRLHRGAPARPPPPLPLLPPVLCPQLRQRIGSRDPPAAPAGRLDRRRQPTGFQGLVPVKAFKHNC